MAPKNRILTTLLQIWTVVCKFILWIKKCILNIISGETNSCKSNRKSEIRVKGIKDLPGPAPIPFFGTTYSNCTISPRDLSKSNEEYFAKYGPIFKHEYFWNIPIIALGNADDIETVMKSTDLRPHISIIAAYRALKIERYDTIGLVNLNGEDWQKLRKETTQQILNSKFINSLVSGLNGIADDFSKNVLLKGPTFLNAANFIFTYVFESAFYLFLGSRVGFLDSDIPEHLETFIVNSNKYFEAICTSNQGFPWWQYMPTKLWGDFTSAEDTLHSLVQRITEESKLDKNKIPGLTPHLQEQNLSPLEVKTVTTEFILGATDPVLQAIILSLYWISKYENVQKKLHQELVSVLRNKDSCIDEESLNRLVYLQACMMEVFRICPVTANMARITNCDLEIQGYHLPAYTVVIGQTWHSYLQEDNFYKASEFIPERWLPNSEGGPMFQPHRKNIVRLFGGGKRICPGNKFAMLATKVFLAKIFRNFKVKFLQDLDIKFVFLVSAVNSVDIMFEECTK